MRSLMVAGMVVAVHGMVLMPWSAAVPSVIPPQATVVRVALVQGSVEAKPVQHVSAPKSVVSERKNPSENKKIEKSSVTEQAQPQQVAQQTERQGNADKSMVTEPRPADYAHNPPPVYPREARLRRMQGVVLLEVRVKASGEAEHVVIHRTSGYKLLDDAAVEAVRQWRFIPARMGNEAVVAKVIVPVAFRLQ